MDHVVVNGVTKQFGADHGQVTALEDVSLTLGRGQLASIIGPSGCGKSTLLRLVADILPPTSGEISVGGLPPRRLREEQRTGFVFQDPTLLPWRSILDNIRLPLQVARGRGRPGHYSPEDLLELVGLQDFGGARPHELSGGMRQRAGIARALVQSPEVLLMDEPFGALDEITRQRMNIELLRIWAESEVTALLVTHSISEAVLMSDRIVVMTARPGRVGEIIDVDLPRPRSLEMMETERFFELEKHVRHALFSGSTGAPERATAEAAA